MPYEVDIQSLGDYVRVEVSGQRNYGDAAMDAGKAGQQIVEYCRKAGIYRVLVILNLSGRLSAVDSYEMVVNSASYGWDFNFKLAFVNTSRASLEDVKFTETVAVNRAYTVQAFADETKAIAWLRG